MATLLVLVDSPSKLATLRQFVDDPSGAYQWRLVCSSSTEWFQQLYRNHLSPSLPESDDATLPLATLANQCDHVVIATSPDLAGDAVARRVAEACGLKNGKVSRIYLPHIARRLFPAAAGKKKSSDWRRSAVWETMLEVDRRVDAALRDLLNVHQKLPIFGLTSAVALDCFARQEPPRSNDAKENRHLAVIFDGKKDQLVSRLTLINGQTPLLRDDHVVKAVIYNIKEQVFTIEAISREEKLSPPPLPFHTGSLFAAAQKELGFPPEKTLAVALPLYNGCSAGLVHPVGFITYPITDSASLPAEEGLRLREHIFAHFGKDYLPEKAREMDELGATAVGAVRPTSLQRTPKKMKKHLSEEQHQLYSLIWQRSLVSQMTDVKSVVRKVTLTGGPQRRYVLVAESEEVVHRGWQAAGGESPLPDHAHGNEEWRLQQELVLSSIDLLRQIKVAEPLTMGSLLDELSELGVCFPEQLIMVPEVLREWGFVEIQEGMARLTKSGREVHNLLQTTHSELVNIKYVQNIKKRIETASQHDGSAQSVLVDLQKLLDAAKTNQRRGADGESISTRRDCPVCGGNLLLQRSASGDFIKCEHYPDVCRYIKAADVDGHRFYGYCQECSHELIVKVGRYGRFLACSSFPRCGFTKPFPLGVKCPAEGCTGEVIERMSKLGLLFYACDHYPTCRFSAGQKPVNFACPRCGNPYVVLSPNDQHQGMHLCPKCKYEFAADKADFYSSQQI